MNIILLGSPGVGKGTYAERISEKLEIPHISTGDLLRDIIKKGTKEGQNIKKIIDKGDLIPDELMMGIVKKKIQEDDCKNGFLLEGVPRTLPQAESLKKMIKVDKVLNYVADEKIILGRLGGRLTCKKCGDTYHVKNKPPKKEGICDECEGELYTRKDQTEEAIKERLKVYHEKTEPLIEYYEKEGILAEIDANRNFAQIDLMIGESLDVIEGEE